MRLIYYDVGTGFLADAHLYHAIDELASNGHEVIYVNPMKDLGAPAPVETYSQMLLDRVRREHAGGGVDLFFAAAWDQSVTADAIRDISAMGIPTVNFSTDDLSHPFRVRRITPAFDLCWTSARESQDILRGYGAKQLMVMPFAANPNMFHPVATPEAHDAIGFIGTAYGARARGIATLAQAEVPVRVYGASPMEVYGTESRGNPLTRALSNLPDASERFFKGMAVPGGRKCIHGALVRTVQDMMSAPPERDPMQGTVSYLGNAGFEEMSAIFADCALSFGSLEVASTFALKDPLLFIRFREFEVAMAGGVHLVNRFPELEEYFEEDREMLYYDNLDELVDKARYYLSPDRASARRSIREQAARRALGEHTWSHRFARICTTLGLRFDTRA